MINKIIILLCCSKGTVDFVRKILHIDILIIARGHILDQFCCVLQPCDLFPKLLLLLGQDGLVVLSIGLHDALLCSQGGEYLLGERVLVLTLLESIAKVIRSLICQLSYDGIFHLISCGF